MVTFLTFTGAAGFSSSELESELELDSFLRTSSFFAGCGVTGFFFGGGADSSSSDESELDELLAFEADSLREIGIGNFFFCFILTTISESSESSSESDVPSFFSKIKFYSFLYNNYFLVNYKIIFPMSSNCSMNPM